MINLIPPSAQEQVKREYWVRVISVWMTLIATGCVVVAVLNIPVYVLVRSQLDAFLVEYKQANLESESFKESEQAVIQANQVAALLAQHDDTQLLSGIVDELDALTGQGIRITDFTISRSMEGGLAPITIKGTAASRLDLTNFRDAIESHPLFSNAELPLSNLAKDRDIEFTITITPKTQE